MAKPDTGRDATDQMFSLIGGLITEWSFVEERLCLIFQICMGTVDADAGGTFQISDNQTPAAVFYTAESFRTKLNIADAALTGRVAGVTSAQDILVRWVKLHTKLRKLSQKRNKIAHWTVLPGMELADGLKPPRLVPPIGSPDFHVEFLHDIIGGRTKALTNQQVRHLGLAFQLLSEKLRDFAYDLARHEGLFDKSVQRLARRIGSLDRTDPTRSERLRRALSSPE